MALPTAFQLALLGFLPTFLAWDPSCINKPVGFGRKTTGGEGGRVVTPKNEAELQQLLKSSEKLIIDLDKAYDYTSSLGQKTEKGCWYSRCGQTAQKALPMEGACVGRPATSVSYHVAGLQINALVVGSQKTIKSSNGKGEIRGRGLLLCNAHNVIIRDITVCDINPDVVWGGDAISLKNTQDVWIHRVTIKNIGRQHLVAHISPNRGVTVSSCLFDGTTKYSSYCDGEHYWIWLFRGPHDEITLINNKILNSAGRIPHAGGLKSSKPFVHIVGNFFDTNGHIGIEPWKGAIILAEANYFYKVRDVVNLKATGGNLALINSPAGAQRCASHFGTTCKVNSFRYSLNRPERIDENALTLLAAVGKEAVNEARAAVCLKGEELSAAAGEESATRKEKPANAKKSSAPIQKQKEAKAKSGKLAEYHKSGHVKQKKQTKTKSQKLAGNNESKHVKQKKQTQKKKKKTS